MRACAAAIGLSVMLTLAGTAAAGKAPANAAQALKIVQALIAQEQAACGRTWKHMTAQGLTMDDPGPPWRVTVIGVVTNKASGTANALAATISGGCRSEALARSYPPLIPGFPRPAGGFPQLQSHFVGRMFQIGASLREARTRRGLSAADVHKGIRIRERYLTALEEEQWDMLPGEAYTKGFLRTYAEFLGLNGNLYIDEYNARIAHRDEEPLVPEALAPKRGPRSSVLRTLVGIFVLGAAVAGLAAWRLAGTSTPPPKARSPVVPVSAAPVVAKPKSKATPTTPTFAVLKATRGRSWLQVRASGPNGALLFQGFIDQGATKRFSLDHAVWVRLGRPDLLDLSIAGHTVTPHSANPANLILTRAGARAA